MRTFLCLATFIGVWGMNIVAVPQQGNHFPVLSVTTDLVTLAVSVVDDHGTLVTGLLPEHFSVYDNGEQRPIELFTSDDLPVTIGLVIDSSGSMRNRRDEVVAAATAFAELSHPLDELFTVNFNESVWPGLPADMAFTTDRNQLRVALAALHAEGMSAVYDAVDLGLAHVQRGTHDRKALIVISDGGDNASTHTFADVLEHARRSTAIIYAVTLFDRDAHAARPRVLKQLAGATGGDVFRPRQPSEVTRSFEDIARELRSGYTIGFQPPENADTGFRRVRVVADAGDGRQLVVRTRAGYYAGR